MNAVDLRAFFRGEDVNDTEDNMADEDYMESLEEQYDESDSDVDTEDEQPAMNLCSGATSTLHDDLKTDQRPATQIRRCPSPPWGRRAAKKQPSRASKSRTTHKKPVTTREKIQAEAESKQKPEQKTNRYVQRARKVPRVTKPVKKKAPSTLNSMVFQDDSYTRIKPSETKPEDRVVNRPTERTRGLKVIMEKMKENRYSVNWAAKELISIHPAASPVSQACNLMRLDQKVRVKIWKHCVIYRDSFIWPSSKKGAEQPDLAMTCRPIRSEVLPIYYGCNNFAVDITPVACSVPIPALAWNNGMQEIDLIKKWMKSLAEGGHMSKIKNWIFSYTPRTFTEAATQITAGKDDKCAFVVVKLEREEASWKANAVEVHSDARCLTDLMPSRGQCVVKKQPDWLNTAVVELLHKAGKHSISCDCIQVLANTITEHAAELSTATCEHVVKSIEHS